MEDGFDDLCQPDGTQAQTLVLNRNWQAVNIAGVRRTFALLFRENARVVSSEASGQNTYDICEWIHYCERHPPRRGQPALHTVRHALRVPDVIILGDYEGLPLKQPRLTREGILERDGHVCQYCGHRFPDDELNIDHVIPRERGGRSTWENLVTSCISCNEKKANRLPHEAGMRLASKPRHPPRLPFAATAISAARERPQWKSYLGQR